MPLTERFGWTAEFALSEYQVSMCRVDLTAYEKNLREQSIAAELRRRADGRPVLVCERWDEKGDGRGITHYHYRLDALVINEFDQQEPGAIRQIGYELAVFLGNWFAPVADDPAGMVGNR